MKKYFHNKKKSVSLYAAELNAPNQAKRVKEMEIGLKFRSGLSLFCKKSSVKIQALLFCLLSVCFFVSAPVSAFEDLPRSVEVLRPAMVVINAYNKQGQVIGVGSGFFINEDGYILTDRRLCVDASTVEAQTYAGDTYTELRVVAEDTTCDLLLLAIEEPLDHTAYIPLTDFILNYEEKVYLLGGPLPVAETVFSRTIGGISSTPVLGKYGWIGDRFSFWLSGGAVMNARGELVGVIQLSDLEKGMENLIIPAVKIGEAIKASVKGGQSETLTAWRQRVKQSQGSSINYSELIFCFHLGRYEQALSLLEMLRRAGQDDLDTLFLHGYALQNLERYNEGIELYKKVLEQDPDSHNTLFYLGVSYCALEKYEPGLVAFLNAHWLQPQDPHTCYNIAFTYQNLQDPKKAIEYYDLVLAIDDEYIPAYCQLGIIYYQLKRYPEAKKMLRRVLEINPEEITAYLYLGLILQDTQDYRGAVDFYEKALEAQPDIVIWYEMGYCWYYLGNYRQAIKCFQEYLSIDPESAGAYYYLGLAYDAQNYSYEALKAFTKATTIDPEIVGSIFEEGVKRYNEGRYDEAIEHLEFVLHIDPLYQEGHRYLAHAYYQQDYDKLSSDALDKPNRNNQYEDAMSDYEEALKSNPEDVEVLYYLGVSYQTRSLYKEAIDLYQQVINLQNDHVDSYLKLAQCYTAEKDYEKAIITYEKALLYQEENPMILSGLGDVYLLQTDYATAIHYYQESLKIFPQNCETYCNLGLAFAGDKRFESAVEAFQQSIAVDRSYEFAYRSLAEFYYERELYKEAFTVYKTWDGFQPGQVWVYYGLGNTCRQMGLFDQAEKMYNKALVIGENKRDKLVGAVYAGLGLLYCERQEYEEAIKAFQTATGSCYLEDAEAYYLMGWIYFQQARYHTSIVYLKEAIKYDPAYEEAYYYLGSCYIEVDDLASAEEAYQTLEELNPERAEELLALISTAKTGNAAQ